MKPEEFVSKVVDSYNQNKGVFAKKANAEELIPKELSPLNKARYIFYVLQLDYAMKSQILYNGARLLNKTNPNFFTPECLLELPDEHLIKTIKEYLRPRYINEAVKRYRHNSMVLLELYQGDPREIFTHAQQCKEVLSKLKNFRGFGPKIGTFFVRTMINTFKYEFSDIDEILPPVDVHDVKIAFMLGYTKSDKMTQKNINFVKILWRDACVKAGKSWLIFDKALWLLGSEGRPKNTEEIQKLVFL